MPLFYDWLVRSQPGQMSHQHTAGEEYFGHWRWRALGLAGLLVGDTWNLQELCELPVSALSKAWLPLCAWKWLGRWMRFRYIMRGPCNQAFLLSHESAKIDPEKMGPAMRVILNNRGLPPWRARDLRKARWPRHALLVPGRRLPRNMVGAGIIRGD